MSTPFFDVRQRVLGRTGQGGDLDAALVGLLDHVDRRRAERVGDQHGPVLQRDVDVGAGHRVQPAEHAFTALALRERRYAELLQRPLARTLMWASGIIALRSTDLPSVGIFIGITTSTP